eukprot:CAMPEP_0201491776 /NCGR_PEP_ID=MMETSP0151_2-20130828/31165_1 /ASSEMBLY_ACC=CAM_ASM_000257 /TAXON_ID=200890 /ORGANISM="Paramoeba atlantica, Strain 621/1 / CCAP 1560/9" /LENGTH=258 /DNA_ID=CAMNT_0047878291 /DNA_START=60 /DNA_END=836 /DNA_ORIENTATION=+
MSLSRAFAIITGGASGLGNATAKYLSQNGAKVLIADLPSSPLKEKAAEIGAAYAETDITNEDSTNEMFSTFASEYGRSPNVVVSCAGIAIARRVLSKKGVHDLESFQKVMNVNVDGTFNVARLAALNMKENDPATDGVHQNERGVIINTASIAAFEGQIGQAAYAASKGAVVGMGISLARDLSNIGVRVNTIAPGIFLTPMVAGLPPQVQTELGSTVPFPSRLGDPEDFGNFVGAIILNPYLNGETVRLDGALRMGPK